MAILLKGRKPDKFEFHSNFCRFSWMWIFTWIKLFWHSCCVGRTGMTQLILAISLWGVLPLIEKNFDTCIVLLFMWRKDFPLHLSLENSADFYLCFWLALFCSVSYYFSLYWSIFLSLRTVFDAISSNIVDVLSINPSAVFIFGDFNINYKDWLIFRWNW